MGFSIESRNERDAHQQNLAFNLKQQQQQEEEKKTFSMSTRTGHAHDLGSNFIIINIINLCDCCVLGMGDSHFAQKKRKFSNFREILIVPR